MIKHFLTILEVSTRNLLYILVGGPVALALAITGCRTPEPVTPEPTVVADNSYAAQMLAQGYVELVGDDIAPFPLPPEPSQIELGTETYRQICLACHGDWGQGLTDEWREEWGQDMNCWQSKCHASNYPPGGFEFPKEIPPVLGVGALAGYANAEELYLNISQTMPWWNPGSLTDEQSWALTAYLMSVRGEVDESVELDIGNASIYPLHAPFEPTKDSDLIIFFLIGFLGVVAITLVKKVKLN